jgi:gliding motility-associated-like protein
MRNRITFIVACIFCLNLGLSQQFPNPVSLSTGQGVIGSLDPLWQVSPWFTNNPPNPIGLTYSPALINNNCAPGSWVNPASLPAPVNNGNWITGNDASCSENTNSGYRYFRLTLNLPSDCNGQSIAGMNNYTLYLSGYVDNSISDVFVNGVSTGISGGNFSPGGQLNIVLNGPWVAGINYIDVLVYNIPNNSTNPYGLLLVADGSSSVLVDSDNDGVSDLYDECVCEPGNLNDGCSAALTGDLSICSGETTTLTIETSGSVVWSTGATTNSIIVSPLNYTSYQATVTQQNGNSSTVSANVTVFPTYNYSIVQSICNGETYNFNGINYDDPGLYSILFQTQNGCDSIINLEIIVNAVYSDTIEASICSGSNYFFEGQNYSQAGVFSVTNQSQWGCDSSKTLVLNVNPTFEQNNQVTSCDSYLWNLSGQTYTSSGIYPYQLITSDGCDSIVNLDLTIINTPNPPVLSINSPKCPGDFFLLNATPSNYPISWLGPLNFSSSSFENTFPSTLSNQGIYSASLNNNGCETEVVEILAQIQFINDLEDIEMPNILTPNADGVNDEWDLSSYAESCSNFTLKIFNRWGIEVFNTNYNGSFFRGKDEQDNELTDGIYFYSLTLENDEKNGFFHIIR